MRLKLRQIAQKHAHDLDNQRHKDQKTTEPVPKNPKTVSGLDFIKKWKSLALVKLTGTVARSLAMEFAPLMLNEPERLGGVAMPRSSRWTPAVSIHQEVGFYQGVYVYYVSGPEQTRELNSDRPY